MIRLSTTGLEPALRTVKNAPRQIRFAAVQAVNSTAVSVQRAVVSRLLPDRFTLRSRGRPWQQPGGPFGFNVRPFARMTQAEPYAVLGSRADWLKLQEEGGVKTTASGKALAIPEPGTARPPRRPSSPAETSRPPFWPSAGSSWPSPKKGAGSSCNASVAGKASGFGTGSNGPPVSPPFSALAALPTPKLANTWRASSATTFNVPSPPPNDHTRKSHPRRPRCRMAPG